jgi:hypothetical protein
METLLDEALRFEKERKKKGLSIWSFGKRNNIKRAIGKGMIALLGLPYFAFAAIASLPMWLTFELLRGKLKDKAFHNTAGLGIKLGMGLIYFPIITALAFCLMPWLVASLLVLLAIPSYGFFYDYKEFIRTYISDIKLLNEKKMSVSFNKIISDFTKL